MKSKLLRIALLAVIAGFGACGGKDDPAPEKSKACDIVSFKAGGKDWTINGLNITATFAKEENITNLSPQIQISDKATISPASGTPWDFSNPATYTVTAGDGTTKKVYTATATKASL